LGLLWGELYFYIALVFHHHHHHHHHHHLYSAFDPVLAGTRAQSDNRYGSGTLHSRQVLGIVYHCFSLPLDVPTFAARYLHVPINASVPSSERWNCVREWSGDFAEMIFYMPQICDMGQTALLPFRRKAF
jgi:hypothetical protein